MSLTIAIPTIGRPTLKHTLDSIARQRLDVDDRVFVMLDTYQEPPRPDITALVKRYGSQFTLHRVNGGVHFYGNPQLNAAIKLAKTDYFCALGDDDIYVDGAFDRLREKLQPGRVVLFRFYAPPYLVPDDPSRFVLWAHRKLEVANISGCCMAAPVNALVPVSDELRCEVDFDWIVDTVAQTGRRPIWMPDVLVMARPEIRHGEPVHQGVGMCPGCGFVGVLENFTDRLCSECAGVVIPELLVSA